MATYPYRCECMDSVVEIQQGMTEDRFTSCLQVYERLGTEPPDDCLARGGCRAERLIADSGGVIVRAGSRGSCSLGEKAQTCGARCGQGAPGQAACPFG